MSDNSFFKPTLLYKEFMILDLIEKDANITQREISKTIGVAVSMINSYVDKYEKNGLIKRKKHSTKHVEYFVTKKGVERRKLLNIWYLKSAQSVYQSATNNILEFLNELVKKGYRSILLYPAGEVAEIILKVINETPTCKINVVAIVDDDNDKRNSLLLNKVIISKEDIINYDHDSILVSSYKHHKILLKNLLSIEYPKNKITQFFD
ncbi:winged helix-turn-helix transcriptional regulator [Liberiplasma polymorphum]|uniref:winged helix-turn-helix transcriptional regulator n=1 Tax=Liberiplasma polymorphum TaxID=3374570 RepID=UPI003773BA0F